MKSRAALIVILCAMATAAGDEPEFQSGKARSAAKAYAASVSRAEADYQAKVTAAKRDYLAALGDAKRAAERSNDVDEGLRIEAQIKALKEEIASARSAVPAAARPPLVIESAVLYADGLVRDETAFVREHVRGDVLRTLTMPQPDLKWGARKWLIVRLVYHGQPAYVTFCEEAFQDFTFGSDLGPVWKERLAKARSR